MITSTTLKERFRNLLREPNFVHVEHFVKSLRKDNNFVHWDDKLKFAAEFKTFLQKSMDSLEVLIQGYRCLCQILVNLIREFEMFKQFPIRKYTNAFNCISKVAGYDNILQNIGYKEEKVKLILGVEVLNNRNDAIDTAFDLLISFMEITELFHLKSKGVLADTLISKRERRIVDERKTIMTDDDIAKMFANCERCDSDVDDKGLCTQCGSSVLEFSFAITYWEFLARKYHIDFPNMVPIVPAVVNEPGWSCGACSLKNSPMAINCEACGLLP